MILLGLEFGDSENSFYLFCSHLTGLRKLSSRNLNQRLESSRLGRSLQLWIPSHSRDDFRVKRTWMTHPTNNMRPSYWFRLLLHVILRRVIMWLLFHQKEIVSCVQLCQKIVVLMIIFVMMHGVRLRARTNKCSAHAHLVRIKLIEVYSSLVIIFNFVKRR